MEASSYVKGETNEQTAQWLFLVLILFVVLLVFLASGYHFGWITWNGMTNPFAGMMGSAPAPTTTTTTTAATTGA